MVKDKKMTAAGIVGLALFLSLLALTTPGTAWAADMIFMKIDGIPGESTDDKHKDWIDVRTWGWSESNPGGAASKGGRTPAQRITFQDLKVTFQPSKATPQLFLAGASGTHIKEVILEVCRAGQYKEKWLEIKLSEVIISGYSILGSTQAHMEEILLGYGKIKVTYLQQKRADGKGGGQVVGGWDLTNNKSIK